MKNLLFLACTLMILLSTSCTNETNELEGTWSAIDMDIDLNLTIEIAGLEVVTEFDIQSTEMNYDLTFEAETFSTSGDYTYDVTNSTNGNAITSSVTLTDVMGSGEYTIEDNILTVIGSFYEIQGTAGTSTTSGEEQSTNFEINADGILILTQTINETETDPITGQVSTTTGTSISRWEK